MAMRGRRNGEGCGGRGPLTLWIGVGVIAVAELLLLGVDLPARGWATVPEVAARDLPQPRGLWQRLGRSVAENMTPLCWVGYLLVFDGLLERAARRRGGAVSTIRARPCRFVFAWLSSIPVWCYFDWVNFYFMDAWRYHGLPDSAVSRYGGYFIAFAAISPGMFLAAQWLNQLGLAQLRTSGVRIGPAARAGVALLGVAFVAYPFATRGPIGNLTLWVSLMFMLDPLNHWLGAPSIIGDWRACRWGRTLSLMGGGAICGLCWEFWNYWAIAKWTYHLPFVGALEPYRYFEMPWIGFIGFLPFAIECWVVLNTLLELLRRLGVRPAESLPDETHVF